MLLGLAAAAIWIAALMPQFFAVWTGSGDALEIVAAHPALWRVNASLFAASAMLSVAGCATILSGALAHPLTVPALALMTVATGLWVAALQPSAPRAPEARIPAVSAHSRPIAKAQAASDQP